MPQQLQGRTQIYKKTTESKEGGEGNWGLGGREKKERRNYVNFYFLCYSTSMDACRDTNKNNKKKIYTTIDA